MPNKTIYVTKQDAALWNKLKRNKVSISKVISDHLRELFGVAAECPICHRRLPAKNKHV